MCTTTVFCQQESTFVNNKSTRKHQHHHATHYRFYADKITMLLAVNQWVNMNRPLAISIISINVYKWKSIFSHKLWIFWASLQSRCFMRTGPTIFDIYIQYSIWSVLFILSAFNINSMIRSIATRNNTVYIAVYREGRNEHEHVEFSMSMCVCVCMCMMTCDMILKYNILNDSTLVEEKNCYHKNVHEKSANFLCSFSWFHRYYNGNTQTHTCIHGYSTIVRALLLKYTWIPIWTSLFIYLLNFPFFSLSFFPRLL